MSNAATAVKQKKSSGFLARFIRRTLLCLFTAVILAAGALALMISQVFTGPSPAARELLAASLSQSQVTAWIPPLFSGEGIPAVSQSQGG